MLLFVAACCHGYLMCVEEGICDIVCFRYVLLFVTACCHGYLMCVEEGGEFAEGDDQVIKHLS